MLANKIIGYLLITAGMLLIMFLTMPLVLPIIALITGLWLINHGLRLIGKGGLWFAGQQIFFSRWR
ncbi:hypothetical protein HOL34_01195 [bacterium]|jgi:hypothetical protein|nr:hypothetical protein [bacterium]MBT3903454.1 hypothetical protein [bacterium]MBT4577808.1 hypothetical protein [bacterium]MBT5346042.1 hypothetical protein [bacterium]MBT6130954.1 hypothetical protein [bacterium]